MKDYEKAKFNKMKLHLGVAPEYLTYLKVVCSSWLLRYLFKFYHLRVVKKIIFPFEVDFMNISIGRLWLWQDPFARSVLEHPLSPQGVKCCLFLSKNKLLKRFSREPLHFSGQKLENEFHKFDEGQITLYFPIYCFISWDDIWFC